MKRFGFVRSDDSIDIPLLRPLFDDMVECEEMIDRDDTQFARRTFVRAAFAFNEGYIYWLKGVVTQWLLHKSSEEKNIGITKIQFLLDKSYRLNDKGYMKEETNRIPFVNFCAFVIRTAAECRNRDPSRASAYL